MKLTYYAKQCFALFFFITMAVVAQDRSIQGTVTDDAGVPMLLVSLVDLMKLEHAYGGIRAVQIFRSDF